MVAVCDVKSREKMESETDGKGICRCGAPREHDNRSAKLLSKRGDWTHGKHVMAHSLASITSIEPSVRVPGVGVVPKDIWVDMRC